MRKIKKTVVFAFLMISISILWSQGFETFDNSNAAASYSDGSFIGDNEFEWFYGQCRNEGAYPIDGSGLLMRKAFDSYVEATIPGGIGDFSFDYRKAFTSNTPRQLELIVNGEQVATTDVFGNESGADETIHTLIVNDINEVGDVTIKIKNVGSTVTDRHAVIDNISWTGYYSHIPVLIAIPSELEGFTCAVGSGHSPSQMFQLSGHNLDGTDVTVSAAFSYEVSTDDEQFSDMITLSNYNGLNQTIYVRLKNGLAFGHYYENLTISGGNAETIMVTLAGRIVEPFIIPYSNPFRTEQDYEDADAQGVIFYEVEQRETDGGFLRVFPNGYLESPLIDFTEFNHLELFFNTATFGQGSYRKLELQISNNGGNSYQSIYSVLPDTTHYEENQVVISLTGANNVSNGKLRIKMTQGTGQIRFRDFLIQEPVGSVPPLISTISQHPSLYVTATCTVSVSADVADGDEEIAFVELYWGNSPEVYTNVIPMTETYQERYITNNDIPVQDFGTTIYYIVYAEDINNLPSSSSERSYTVSYYDEDEYYSSVENLSGAALHQGLRSVIMNNHEILAENEAKSILYLELDNYEGLVQCIYTGDWELPGTPPDFTPIGFSYEHSYPQSWYNESGDNISEQAWANNDLHHLFPARGDANASRGNRPFDYITEINRQWGSNTFFSYQGGNAYSKAAFEVADDYKGNIARALFYFTIRYYDTSNGLTRGINENNMIDMLPILYQWHILDPVDENEMIRNHSVYSVQGNRNPFIDRPEYVTSIWGDLLLEPPQNLTVSDIGATSFTAHWNSVDRAVNYRIDVSTDPTFLTNHFVSGFKNLQIETTSLTVTGLQTNETYFFRLRTVDNMDGRISLHSDYASATPAGAVIYYWNFNEMIPFEGANWHQPIVSQVGNGELSYTFGEAVSYGGTTINSISDDTAGGSFTPQSGVANINNGKYLELSAPTGLYKNILLSYSTRRTDSGFATHEIQYTIDGNNWTIKEIVNIESFSNIWNLDQVIVINFSDIPEVNHNADFAIRIYLDGATHAAGSNRLDNIQIVGTESFEQLPSPQNVAIFIEGNEVVITWDTVTGASNYRVESSTFPEGSYTTASGSINGTQWVGALDGSQMFYRIIAE